MLISFFLVLPWGVSKKRAIDYVNSDDEDADDPEAMEQEEQDLVDMYKSESSKFNKFRAEPSKVKPKFEMFKAETPPTKSKFESNKKPKLDIGVAPETKIKSKGDDSSNERVVFVSKYFSSNDKVEKSDPDNKEPQQNHSSPVTSKNSEIDSKLTPTQNSKVASSKSFLRQISRIYSKPEPNEVSKIETADDEISSDDETTVQSKSKKDFKKRSKFF